MTAQNGECMHIYQLLSTIAYGDAVSNDTIAMEKAIKQMGISTRIYAESIVPPLDKKTALPVDELNNVDKDDIIIFHMSTGSKLNFEVAKYECRKIVVYHNITPPEYFKNNDTRFTDICEYGLEGARYLADKVDYCLAVSNFNKTDLINMGYKCPIDVLPIIIPMSDYDKKPDKSVIKECSDGYTNILFTGRIAPNKKQENLIASFYYYNRLYNNKSRLILAGSFRYDDPYYIRLTEYTKKLGMGESVVFTGHIKFNQIFAYYKTADVFLCMSEHEGFCVPLVEAMKFNVPIIAYNKTAVPETMNYKGMILDDNNPQYVAACIDRMVKDKKLRENVIEEQKERLDYYSYDHVSDMFKMYLSDFIKKGV